jgi:hypothetical protein
MDKDNILTIFNIQIISIRVKLSIIVRLDHSNVPLIHDTFEDYCEFVIR